MTQVEIDEFVEIEEFADILRTIGSQTKPHWSEREVEMAFLNQGFFRLLGYTDVGNTLRNEYVLPSREKVDFVTMSRSDGLRTPKTTVYEFKNPEISLQQYEEQLFSYIGEVSADFGVLTNGIQFWLYDGQPATGPKKMYEVDLQSATEGDASALLMGLSYLSIEERNLRTFAQQVASEIQETIPDKHQIAYSDAQLDVFAEFLAEYLQQELTS